MKTFANGLTPAQIQARPEPYVGMPAWCMYQDHDPVTRGWRRLSRNTLDMLWHKPDEHGHFLLPGEPGCPWPPPPEFRHEWREGDRAWVLHHGEWAQMYVDRCTQCEFELSFHIDGTCRAWVATHPALYIPPGIEHRFRTGQSLAARPSRL